MVKHLSTMLEPWVRLLDWEVPWRRKRQPTPVLLPRKSHGRRSLVSMGVSKSQTRLSNFTQFAARSKKCVCVCVCFGASQSTKAIWGQHLNNSTDCGTVHELLIAKLRLKKVGKTIRPFRYHLNQIPYDYTVEVINRFKGLDLIDRVPEDLWTEVHDIVQEAGIKTIPKEKKCIKLKWLSEEALQIAEKSREANSKGQKER